MAAWTLTDQEWDDFDEFQPSARDARVFRNATIIPMSSRGRSRSQPLRHSGVVPRQWITLGPHIALRGLPASHRRVLQAGSLELHLSTGPRPGRLS